MRVIQFIGSRKLGGAENFFARLANSLGNHIDCQALTTSGSMITPLLTCSTQAVKVWSVHDPISKFMVRHKLEAMSPDILQTWMGRATRLTPKKRQYIHIARLGGYYDVVNYREADYLVGNTKGICDYLVKSGIDAKKVFHISNFVTPSQIDKNNARKSLREELMLTGTTKIIFSLGRLHQNKGFDSLLKAFAILNSSTEVSHLRLVIAGDGPLREELARLARDLKINQQVIWLGWRTDVDFLMAASDLFVCPSRHEPLGNVLLEAWGQQLPIISTMNDGALEITTQDETAVLVPVDQPDALGLALKEWLFADPQVYQANASRGLECLHDKYSQEAITGNYLELYDGVIK